MKYNVYEKQTNMEVRNAQIVYMYHELKMYPKEISKYVDLALSTIRNYVRKFIDLLDKAKQWFANSYKYIGEIKNAPCAYILEFFNVNNEKMFLKVGKTKHIETRISQLLKEYNAKRVEIKQIFYTKTENFAEMVESMLREHYQNVKNCGFVKMDRFTKAIYNFEELKNDYLLQKTLEICV